VIETAAKLRWAVTIIGDGPEKNRILSLAQELNVDLTLVPFCKREELARLIANSSVFVFGGIEDFGILPVESIACGTPVVGLNQGGLMETVLPGAGFLVNHFDEFPAACISALDLSPFEVSKYAESFSEARFVAELKQIVSDYIWKERLKGSAR
jgi:glycosyltransferase involved in cell wall biosynthesis